MRFYTFFSLLILASVLVSCEDEVDERPSDEILRLEAYMRIHYPDLKPLSSGLYFIPIEQGVSTTPPDSGNFILYDYTIQNLNGRVGETTIRHTAWLHDMLSRTKNYTPIFTIYRAPTSTLISGIRIGIGLMTEGDSARLIMPSSLAYGNRNQNNMGTYASIISDIKLHRVITDPVAFEQERIDSYLADNYPDLVPSEIYVDSIYVLDIEEGRGDLYKDEESVRVNYVGYHLNGHVFDTNIRDVAEARGIYNSQKTYSPLTVRIGTVDFIKGFSSALRQLKAEGSARVLIPSYKAYGASGTANIYPYTPLVFDIIVVDTYAEEEDD